MTTITLDLLFSLSSGMQIYWKITIAKYNQSKYSHIIATLGLLDVNPCRIYSYCFRLQNKVFV